MYREPVLRADGPFQSSLGADIREVQNGAAAVANKVAVGGGHGVEPLLTLHDPHALHLAGLLKKGQVAIDRAQAQVRVTGLELLVDPLGGGVTACPPDGGQDGLPLFTVANGALHGPASLTILILVMSISYHICRSL